MRLGFVEGRQRLHIPHKGFPPSGQDGYALSLCGHRIYVETYHGREALALLCGSCKRIRLVRESAG